MKISIKAKTKEQLIFIFLTSLFLASFPILAGEEPVITFSYAFLYRTKDLKIQTIDYTKSSFTLDPQDQLKIFLKPEENVYLYLYLKEEEGNLYLIYPRFFHDFDEKGNLNPGFYFPGGFEWLSFEQGSGTERFYILASTKRLTYLEQLTDDYLTFYEKNKASKESEIARKDVLEEIRRLQVGHFEFVKKIKTGIQMVAGDFRGFEEVFEFPAQRITGVLFYSRTIRIIH